MSEWTYEFQDFGSNDWTQSVHSFETVFEAAANAGEFLRRCAASDVFCAARLVRKAKSE